MNKGVISTGIKCPILKRGDDLAKIVANAVLDATAVYDNGYSFSNDDPFYYSINNNKN